ncbi:MAG: hybrid sensor histidine kinase/response regulator [Campylobacterota bacterium]|nr:hybrid sensor histidine kinase/response regulator [Campylobacterota bacterium]
MIKDKQTILIVDDEPSNIDILYNVLSDNDIVTATNGNIVFEVLETEDVDLILLDIMMPEMDGFEVCQKIKENPKTNKIPIIFLSAKNQFEDIKIGFELGAVDYITKPFNPYELRIRIDTHLKLISYQNNLKNEVVKEIEKNKIKTQVLYQQSKQAEIGELLMHIAHQWKQPLSEISSINNYNLSIYKQESNNNIINKELEDNANNISEILTFMSDTVETFTNFYKPVDEKTFFNIKDAVNTSKNLISATCDFYNIKLSIILEDDISVYGNENEYSQVLLIILNNAKDIFIKNSIENPEIVLTIKKYENSSKVIINDNGGGIKMENVDDVFLQYTTKNNSSGIGLYMAKEIMKKNEGTLTVKNTNNGAEFTIIL